MKQILTILLVFAGMNIFAQIDAKHLKFGKGIEPFLKKSNYEIGPSANAVILFDKVLYTYGIDGDDFVMHEEHHRRVKVLDKAGADWANIELPYYAYGRSEEIQRIKAVAYNMVDGKLQETKLTRKDIFDVETNKYWSKKKFGIPEVKAGTVFEYKYVKSKKAAYDVPKWYFEFDIPNLYSEVRLDVPEWVTYRFFARGNVGNLNKDERPIKINLSAGYQSVSGSQFKWWMNDIKALLDEPYVTTMNDHRSHIDIQLVSINFPGQTIKKYNNTWHEVKKQFLENEDFGKKLNGNNWLEEVVASLTAGANGPEEKAEKIFYGITNKVNWTEFYSLTTSHSLKKTWEGGKGNMADINLLLCAALRFAGIEANPLLVNRRSEGEVNMFHPKPDAFSHPIVIAEINDKKILMNAATQTRAMNYPRIQDLNSQGLIIKEGKVEFADIKSLIPMSSALYSVTGEISDDGNFSGEIQLQETGYISLSTRADLKEKEEVEIIEEMLADEYTDVEASEIEVENLDDVTESLRCKASIEINNYAQVAGDLIYLNPFILGRLEENPFKSENRSFPVNFPYPFSSTKSIRLKIPEGYSAQELPKPKKVALPDKSASLIYSVSAFGNEIQIVNKYHLQETIYPPDIYSAVRQFHDILVENYATQIVLKKN